MTILAVLLANPVLVSISVLIFVAALIKVLTLKFESISIPPTRAEIKAHQIKKNFLWFAVFIPGLLIILNFMLVIAGS